MNDRLKILTAMVFIAVAISLPVTIVLINQPQTIKQQATEVPSANAPTTTGCPAINPDGTTNICRPQSYCNSGETVNYGGNDMCTKNLGRISFCCTVPKNPPQETGTNPAQ